MHWYNLTDLLPPVYKRIKSMFAAANSENIELLKINVVSGKIQENFFIQTCDETTLKYWESLLGIEIYSGETITERREMILTHLINNQPITIPFTKEKLNEMFGQDNWLFHIGPDELEVEIAVWNASLDKIESFYKWFSTVCPAHIKWYFAHEEPAESGFAVYAHAESDYEARATVGFTTGTTTLYLGPTSYTVDTLET